MCWSLQESEEATEQIMNSYHSERRSEDTYVSVLVADFEFTPDSRCVLDLPHALSEALDANAAAVLHLVTDVGDDVFWREAASEEGERSITDQSMFPY